MGSIDHNIYYQGKVQSLKFKAGESNATVGVITPGDYEFDTSSAEHVIVLSGTLDVLLPGSEWRRVVADESYDVATDTRFQVRASEDVAYICFFLPS